MLLVVVDDGVLALVGAAVATAAAAMSLLRAFVRAVSDMQLLLCRYH